MTQGSSARCRALFFFLVVGTCPSQPKLDAFDVRQTTSVRIGPFGVLAQRDEAFVFLCCSSLQDKLVGVVEDHSSANGLTEHQITQRLVRSFRQRFGLFQNGLLLLRQHAVQTAHDG